MGLINRKKMSNKITRPIENSVICFRKFSLIWPSNFRSTYCIVSTGKRLASTKRSNELLVHRVFIMFMYPARPFLLCSNQPRWRPKPFIFSTLFCLHSLSVTVEAIFFTQCATVQGDRLAPIMISISKVITKFSLLKILNWIT